MRLAIGTMLAFALAATPAGAQQAATVCKDGSTSAAAGRGACSDHGGVDKKATKAAAKVVKAEAKQAVKDAKATGSLVSCSDGTQSKPGRGACSHHGGIQVAGAAGTSTTMPVPLPRPNPVRTMPSTAAPGAPVASSRRREDNDPTGALAQCKDGLYSHSAHRRGACSRHGGVAKWMAG